jgi:peroxiredoxin Q/BCP
MAQLRQDHAQFQAQDAVIVVVGPEDAQSFTRYFREQDLPFTGIPDPDHRVLKLYGQEVNLFKLGSMPAQVMIDRQGTVRYVHYGHAMSDIPENAELLALLADMNAA